jgi:hypothetical protein
VAISTTVTPIPTPTPTPTVEGVLADGEKPARPAALDEPPTIEGSIAVISYFLQLFPYAQNTGDLTEVRALSHPECVFCASVIEGVEGLAAREQRSIGGAVRIEDVSALALDPDRWFTVKLTLHEAPSQEVMANGFVVNNFADEKEYLVDAVVLFENGAWSIRGVDHELVAP